MTNFAIGEIDKCLDFLDKAVEEQEALMPSLYVSPHFDPLCSHPRYKALLRKMNLEP